MENSWRVELVDVWRRVDGAKMWRVGIYVRVTFYGVEVDNRELRGFFNIAGVSRLWV